MKLLYYFILILSIKIIYTNENLEANTDLISGKEDRLLLFATLEGTLVAIEQLNGLIRWKIKEKPIVQVPVDTTNAIVPIFLPDPKDGSLYLLGDKREPLKKLPFSIPQLVASSPCRSSDGILYTGKKKDSWFRLDPKTGNKQQILGWGEYSDSTCPVISPNSIYIGRTKYSIMMVDSNNSQRKWNVTYYDYTSKSMNQEQLHNYDLVHFASSSTGRLVTMDRRYGNLLWDIDLGSPVVAIYILNKDGLLMTPFTSLANHTLSYLTTELLTQSFEAQPHHMKLYPTLYIGDHLYGLYALPSLVDQNSVTVTMSNDGPLLLSGPNAPDLPKRYPEYPLPGYNYHLPEDAYNNDPLTFQSIPNIGNQLVIFIGHYNVPKYSDTRFLLPGSTTKINLITDESKQQKISDDLIIKTPSLSLPIQNTDRNLFDNSNPVNNNISYIKIIRQWVNQQDNKGLKLMLIILTGCVITMFWYLQMQVREFHNLSQNGSNTSNHSKELIKNGLITAISEELPNGYLRIGKIIFNPNELLGKGCEGTFVYRGKFDERQVAVKRLLPECFTFADREVALLRESDAHPNVIRYYCMEQDRLFRYIALELCQATLSDYVQKRIDRNLIKPLEILRQATSGLDHLHFLDIVHRDIKPHNVLISVSDNRREVRVMISDFGLCKKLQVGRVSFSRRSGVTGTDGWIAPEMLDGNQRTTCAVDLFSLGCLYYYVLTNGQHPFGDTLCRQSNILNDYYNLNDLYNYNDLSDVSLKISIISALISSKPEKRPKCKIVLQHPLFWDNAKILNYFQDISDRIEKSDQNDEILITLEENSSLIVKGDWRCHIHEDVASDIKKYRSYRGDSIRDLLRALRNKKHHFRELSEAAQQQLGDIPDSFTKYWTFRFPLLLIHTWITMQYVSNEKLFENYYSKDYKFSLIDHNEHIKNFIKENPIDYDFVKNYDFTKLFSYNNNSPKKSINFNDNNYYRGSNYRSKFKLKVNEEQEQQPKKNVGLYRNLPLNDSNNDNDDDNCNKKTRTIIHRKFNYNNNKKKNRRNDEPIQWAIKDN